MSTGLEKLNVLMCELILWKLSLVVTDFDSCFDWIGGTGEYTTGWTGAGASTSDKKVKIIY